MSHDEAEEVACAISEMVRQAFAKVPELQCLQLAIHVDGSIAISAASDGETGTDQPFPFYRLRTTAHRAWLFDNLAQHIVDNHDNGVSVFYPSGRFAKLIVVWPSSRRTISPIECIPVRLPQGRSRTTDIIRPQMSEA